MFQNIASYFFGGSTTTTSNNNEVTEGVENLESRSKIEVPDNDDASSDISDDWKVVTRADYDPETAPLDSCEPSDEEEAYEPEWGLKRVSLIRRGKPLGESFVATPELRSRRNQLSSSQWESNSYDEFLTQFEMFDSDDETARRERFYGPNPRKLEEIAETEPSRPMEESWFVTPPPCFSSQTGPVILHTSPMENLLIEHPSMSVYLVGDRSHPFRRTSRDQEEDCRWPEEQNSSCEEEEFSENESDGEQVPPRARRDLVSGRPRYNHVMALKDMNQKIMERSRKAQQVQLNKASQKSARKYLTRNNKAREAQARNHTARRSDRCAGRRRSHANNNRKC